LLLERSQNLVAPSRILQALLIVIEPERGVNTNKDQNQFCHPTTDP
jgi:hypothetical protein